MKGAGPQHSESEMSYPLPRPATSARPRPSFFQRECTEKRSPVVVLCMAKSRSPPPVVSFAYVYRMLFRWVGCLSSLAPMKLTSSFAGPTLEYAVTSMDPVACLSCAGSPKMARFAASSKAIVELPEVLLAGGCEGGDPMEIACLLGMASRAWSLKAPPAQATVAMRGRAIRLSISIVSLAGGRRPARPSGHSPARRMETRRKTAVLPTACIADGAACAWTVQW